MAFNSLMIRLTAEALAYLPAHPTIIELGNQTFKPRGNILREIENYLGGAGSNGDIDGLRKFTGGQRQGTAALTADYLKAIGFSAYACIDVNDRYGALQMDLNQNLAESYGYRETFDVVTNNGTGEHVFDQAAVFRNMHALAKPGGLFIHSLPFHNYTNHGFYCFQPGLFQDLAQANNYRVIRLSLATATGEEIAFAERPPQHTTRPLRSYPLAEAGRRTTAWPGWSDMNAAHLKRARAKLGSAMRRLSFRRANILVVAILQKQHETPFRAPMQGMYAGGNISSEQIASNYDRG
jgi:SAM-dependent methyltransferase